MENQPTSDKTFEKFTWTINNFSKLDVAKLYSETFFIGGYPWRILIFPKGEGNKRIGYLSIFLDYVDLDNLPQDWSRFANFKLALINQVNGQKTITHEYEHKCAASKPVWPVGCQKLITLSKLRKTRGFIMNDTCIFEAEIAVRNPVEHVNQADHLVISKPAAASVEPIENVADPLSKEYSAASCGELVDFKNFGKIEEVFVPLLEEVCSWHPSLIDCQRKRKRSPRFTEWAFSALGRVLHFLKTTKVKDMNEDARSHLQILWEELQMCNFDLTWLQPHIQSALSMKCSIEKAVQLQTLKENVATLDMEFKSVEAKLFSAKVDLEIARRDLAKEGFEDRDLDAELGYGGP